jgi:hypothetical protein
VCGHSLVEVSRRAIFRGNSTRGRGSLTLLLPADAWQARQRGVIGFDP